jgi:hypothetical protein
VSGRQVAAIPPVAAGAVATQQDHGAGSWLKELFQLGAYLGHRWTVLRVERRHGLQQGHQLGGGTR